MNIHKTKELSSVQASQVHQLWNDEYPLKLKDRFPILLDGTDNHHHYIIEDTYNRVMAWAVEFEKEQQVRFSIIVASEHKGKGLGGLLINRLKAENSNFYGWVIDHNNDLKSDGQHYLSPMPFYLKHGFEVLNERIDNEMINAVLIRWTSDNRKDVALQIL